MRAKDEFLTEDKGVTGWRQGPGAAGVATRRARGIARSLRVSWSFLLFVIVPTAVLALYYFAFAAGQYESEAHFMVRTSQPAASAPSNIGQVLGLSGGLTQGQTEAYSISDYLTSHDAAAAVDRKLGLVPIFRRPEADPLSRLWGVRPAAETLLKYYRRHVSVVPNQDTAVTTLRVRAFRRADAQRIAELLLELGEQRVNALNLRAEAA